MSGKCNPGPNATDTNVGSLCVPFNVENGGADDGCLRGGVKGGVLVPIVKGKAGASNLEASGPIKGQVPSVASAWVEYSAVTL